MNNLGNCPAQWDVNAAEFLSASSDVLYPTVEETFGAPVLFGSRHA